LAEGGGMPTPDVVTASLAALSLGEVVCVPGLAEPAAIRSGILGPDPYSSVRVHGIVRS
jgi:hypothetical protein